MDPDQEQSDMDLCCLSKWLLKYLVDVKSRRFFYCDLRFKSSTFSTKLQISTQKQSDRASLFWRTLTTEKLHVMTKIMNACCVIPAYMRV